MIIYNDFQQLLPDFLNENYPEIFKSINDEGYIIEYPTFHSIKEILFDGKVVGFLSLDSFHIIPNDFLINECYILPEYRGNNLLYLELFALITTPNVNIFLRNPNKAVINVLLKNNLAYKISSNLFVSYIDFTVMIDSVYKNPKIKRFYKKTEDKVPYKANLFDMDLCSSMFLDPTLEYIKYSDVFALTLPRKNDLKKYKLRKKLKRVNESYLDKCYDAQQDSQDEILEFFDDVADFIYESISVENVLGTAEALTPAFSQYLADNNLSDEDGFKIINHINKALNEGNLIPESCKRRMNYLVENIDAVDRVLDEDSRGCPFCGNPNPDFIECCEYCGQSIRNESYADELLHQMENFSLDDMLEELKDDIDFDKLLGKVPIEENDSLLELKTFYNDYLTGLDFEEIRQYYLNSNDDEHIDTIIQSYFDDKISNENSEREKFSFYTDYLLTSFYYHLDNSRFDEALSRIIQLAILASNCDDDGEGNIIERKPRSFDIRYEIDKFKISNPTFDLENSYKLAIDKFKVDYWLNNESEVFDAISELLS